MKREHYLEKLREARAGKLSYNGWITVLTSISTDISKLEERIYYFGEKRAEKTRREINLLRKLEKDLLQIDRDLLTCQ